MKFRRLYYQRLDQEAQETWKNKLFDMAEIAVPNIQKQQFEAFFFGDQMTSAKYFIIEDKRQDKELVAFYCSYHQVISLEGKATYIYNSRVIIKPDYQGKSALIKTFIAQFKAFGLFAMRYGGYWVSNTVNPISYHGVVNTSWESYPRYDAPLPPKMAEILRSVSEINHFNLVKSKDILKTTSGIPPLYTEAQLARMYQSSKPHIKFFLDQEVDFLQGEGIPVVVPYTFKNISLTVLRALKRSLF